MSDRSFELWRMCLLGVCAFMVLFGVSLVFFDSRFIPGFTPTVSESLWNQPEIPANVATYYRFTHGVIGATVAGWALMMVFVVQHPFRRRERWAWWAMLAGPALWFVLDVGASLYHGVYANAALNACSYAPLLVPLLFTRGAFKPEANASELSPPAR